MLLAQQRDRLYMKWAIATGRSRATCIATDSDSRQ
jgi:hypothetical protein